MSLEHVMGIAISRYPKNGTIYLQEKATSDSVILVSGNVFIMQGKSVL